MGATDRDRRGELTTAALAGEYEPDAYMHCRVLGEPDESGEGPYDLVAFVAIFGMPDKTYEFTAGYDDGVSVVEHVRKLPGLEEAVRERAPGPRTPLLYARQVNEGDQVEAMMNTIALDMAQEAMAPYGLPAAIVIFLRASDGREAVDYWYPPEVVPPDRLFAAFVNWAMNYKWAQ